MSQETLTQLSNQPDGGVIVAIDGPSGTGKSTAARALATLLGARYLDTGAMYRVATLAVLDKGIDPADVDSVIACTEHLPLVVNEDPHSREVLLDGRDVSEVIRGKDVTANVSAVSAIPQVRENLVELQRRLAREAGRCVVEGRDIGTVVITDAPVKVYLTASAEVRATRRMEQDLAAGRDADFAAILADIERRDHLDSTRATSPLRPAEDATIIDTSDLTFDEVISQLVAEVERSAR